MYWEDLSTSIITENLNINYKSSKEREGFNVTHSSEEGNVTRLISIVSKPKIIMLLKIIRETPKTFEKLLWKYIGKFKRFPLKYSKFAKFLF